MEINLKVKLDDSVQEAINLHKFITEHNVDGFESTVKRIPSKSGTMSTGGFSDIVTIIISSGVVTTVVTSLFAIIQKFLEGRNGEIELSYKLADGKEFTQKFGYTSVKERDKIKKEFEQKFSKFYGNPIIINN